LIEKQFTTKQHAAARKKVTSFRAARCCFVIIFASLVTVNHFEDEIEFQF